MSALQEFEAALKNTPNNELNLDNFIDKNTDAANLKNFILATITQYRIDVLKSILKEYSNLLDENFDYAGVVQYAADLNNIASEQIMLLAYLKYVAPRIVGKTDSELTTTAAIGNLEALQQQLNSKNYGTRDLIDALISARFTKQPINIITELKWFIKQQDPQADIDIRTYHKSYAIPPRLSPADTKSLQARILRIRLFAEGSIFIIGFVGLVALVTTLAFAGVLGVLVGVFTIPLVSLSIVGVLHARANAKIATLKQRAYIDYAEKVLKREDKGNLQQYDSSPLVRAAMNCSLDEINALLKDKHYSAKEIAVALHAAQYSATPQEIKTLLQKHVVALPAAAKKNIDALEKLSSDLLNDLSAHFLARLNIVEEYLNILQNDRKTNKEPINDEYEMESLIKAWNDIMQSAVLGTEEFCKQVNVYLNNFEAGGAVNTPLPHEKDQKAELFFLNNDQKIREHLKEINTKSKFNVNVRPS